MKRYKTVGDYIAHARLWQDELERLRGSSGTRESTGKKKQEHERALKDCASVYSANTQITSRARSAKKLKKKRIQKIQPLVAAGKGLHDKYR